LLRLAALPQMGTTSRFALSKKINLENVFLMCGCRGQVWDLLVSDREPVTSFSCCESGVRALAYLAGSQRLICAGHHGEMALCDLRQGVVVKEWHAHQANITDLVIDEVFKPNFFLVVLWVRRT
jgi:hypothetical protein